MSALSGAALTLDGAAPWPTARGPGSAAGASAAWFTSPSALAAGLSPALYPGAFAGGAALGAGGNGSILSGPGPSHFTALLGNNNPSLGGSGTQARSGMSVGSTGSSSSGGGGAGARGSQGQPVSTSGLSSIPSIMAASQGPGGVFYPSAPIDPSTAASMGIYGSAMPAVAYPFGAPAPVALGPGAAAPGQFGSAPLWMTAPAPAAGMPGAAAAAPGDGLAWLRANSALSPAAGLAPLPGMVPLAAGAHMGGNGAFAGMSSLSDAAAAASRSSSVARSAGAGSRVGGGGGGGGAGSGGARKPTAATWQKKSSTVPNQKRGAWSPEEDEQLRVLIERELSRGKSLLDIDASDAVDLLPGRSIKQIRERWRSNLDPNIKHGIWYAAGAGEVFARPRLTRVPGRARRTRSSFPCTTTRGTAGRTLRGACPGARSTRSRRGTARSSAPRSGRAFL